MVMQRLTNTFRRKATQETIGTTAQHYSIQLNQAVPYYETVDRSKADYRFYDRLRRGEVVGCELAGGLAKTVASKVAQWTLGMAPQISFDNEELSSLVNDWLSDNLHHLIRHTEDMVALGDYYLAVTPDGLGDVNLVAYTPDIVQPLVNAANYKDIVGWQTFERINHPTDMTRYMLLTNDFYNDLRREKVEFESGQPIIRDYPNLIGRLNFIPMRNNRMSNDIYGRPEVAPLVATAKGLLYAYNEVLSAGIAGNIRLGRPTPVIKFKDYEQMEAFMSAYATPYSVQQFNEITQEYETIQDFHIEFDADRLLAISGADFGYEHPGQISEDVKVFLGVLFLLIIQTIEIPEFVLGGELTSSRSTAETQLETFERWVAKKQSEMEQWLRELLKCVAELLALQNPGVGAFDVESISIQWQPLTSQDGTLTLEVVKWAYSQGLLDKRTALQLIPADIEDIEAVLEAADEESEQARQNTEQFFAFQSQQAEQAALASGEDTQDNE